MLAEKPLTPLSHVFYTEADLADGVWLDPPINANYVLITAEATYLYWRDDGVIGPPGHVLVAAKSIDYHGSKLNFVTLRGNGRAAVTFYRM